MNNEKVEIPVLDHGFVRMLDVMGTDLTVANAARVSFFKESSFDADGSLREGDRKLIDFLAKHDHWTPFAHPQVSLHVKAPVSIRTQLFKSKIGLTENELSRRYVKSVPEYYTPRWRSSPTDGAKQGSSGFMKDTIKHDQRYRDICDDAVEMYQELLDYGVAPEQARFILPQGMYTEWHWTGSLSAFARVYNLRSDPHAQWECQEYAKAIAKLISPLFPYCWLALTQSVNHES